jgi:hypothetical protein
MSRASVLALMALACAATACGHHRAPQSDYGIRPCPPSADDRLLSADALQCWFTAANGRWRTLSHESHYAVLVVSVEAADVRDAEMIAQRFVTSERQTFSEILLYVQRELRSAGSIVRRIRWTLDGGFEALDFNLPIDK